MKKINIVDHIGNEFDSMTKLCEYWKIPRRTFSRYYNKGHDVTYIMSLLLSDQKPTKGVSVTDHLGNEYKSITELCNVYGITTAAYKHRKTKLKWSTEKTLTTPIISKKVHDHMGNEFASIKELCKFYKIAPSTYRLRLNQGLSMYEILTQDTIHPKIECTDHKGKIFASKTDMCAEYGISINTFAARIKQGWTVERALTTPVFTKHKTQISDTIGNTFDSIRDMCKHYGVIQSNYYVLIQNHSTIEALNLIPTIHIRLKNKNIINGLTVIEHINNNYYMCKYYGNEIILHESNIIQFAQKELSKNQNKKIGDI